MNSSTRTLRQSPDFRDERFTRRCQERDLGEQLCRSRPKDRAGFVREHGGKVYQRVVQRYIRSIDTLRTANRLLRNCENPIHVRRPVHRAPVRSIALRTRTTRKRPTAKAGTSIGGDPDPVSPSRALQGGAL